MQICYAMAANVACQRVRPAVSEALVKNILAIELLLEQYLPNSPYTASYLQHLFLPSLRIHMKSVVSGSPPVA